MQFVRLYPNNQKKIKVRINGPCLVKRDAIFRLRVRTIGEKYYENIIKLKSLYHHFPDER